DNFSRIGGNVAVATSMAVAKAAADSLGLPLYRYLGGVFSPSMPYPLGNVLGGGKHSIGGTDIQEYLVMAKAKKFRDCAIINAKVHRRVGEVLREKLPGVAIGRGDEGAWNAPLPDLEALDLVISCAREVEEEYGVKIDLGLDVAASHLWRNGKYYYRDRVLTRDEQIEFIAEIVEHYNLRVVEDPLHEDDFEGFARLTDIVGKDTLIVGDDLYVTQSDRIERGTEMGAGNAVLIKPNQVGTLTDTFSAIKKAKKHGFNIIVSHRSGETCDSTIAHIAVAAGAYAIKTGAISGERVAKLNEIMRIEDLEEAW
ncbi:MAG: enolase, partial [Thermoplasmata archaeon]